jgi:hypothetical protein
MPIIVLRWLHFRVKERKGGKSEGKRKREGEGGRKGGREV